MKRCSFFFLIFCLAAQASALFLVDLPQDIIATAQKQKGVPYVYGGTSPKGFDCSGFIYFVFKEFVTDIPRASRVLGTYGHPVAREKIRPGDLLFFATGSDPKQISHVALYLGQNSIIHAASAGPKTGIIITDLEERYWKSRYHSARRVDFPEEAEVSMGEPGRLYQLEYARGKYSGGMIGGEPAGQGTFTLQNGDVYQGAFKNGLFEGQGVYQWKDSSVYKGLFKQGKFDGKGSLSYASGNSYEGEWKDDKIEGRGLYVWASGARYEGKFANFLETGGWYTSPEGQRAWAKSDNGSLRFYTDETAKVPAVVTGPKLASARAIGAKNLNQFSKPETEWDDFVGPDFPQDWDR